VSLYPFNAQALHLIRRRARASTPPVKPRTRSALSNSNNEVRDVKVQDAKPEADQDADEV
jgi:hypothetical protein